MDQHGTNAARRGGAQPIYAIARCAQLHNPKELSMTHQQERPMLSLAVVEMTSPIAEVQRLLASEPLATEFRLEPCKDSPPGSHWVNVCVDMTDALAAMRTIRNLLFSLLHFADRGLVEHFRIVTGSDLLRRPEPKADDGAPDGGPCAA
jgi:hypothetical protein